MENMSFIDNSVSFDKSLEKHWQNAISFAWLSFLVIADILVNPKWNS